METDAAFTKMNISSANMPIFFLMQKKMMKNYLYNLNHREPHSILQFQVHQMTFAHT